MVESTYNYFEGGQEDNPVAIWLQSVSPKERAEILLDMTDAALDQMPQEIQREAQALKQPKMVKNVPAKMMYGEGYPEVEIPKRAYDPEKSYIANLNRGPILLTAPHSNVMFRGGEFMNDKLRTHMREHWASSIVLKLSHAIAEIQRNRKAPANKEASYVVWNCDQSGVKKEQVLDPNYLIQSQFKHSAFHRSLHLFMQRNEGLPLLHLDIHGKQDTATKGRKAEIEVGAVSLHEWVGKGTDEQNFTSPIVKNLISNMN